MKNSKLRRALLLVACAVLLVSISVSATLAYLTAKSEVVTNTFTTASLDVHIKEHEYNAMEDTLDTNMVVDGNSGYKLFPGATLKKDPFVYVTEADSYIFVEIINKAADYVTVYPSAQWAPVAKDSNIYGYIGDNSDGTMMKVEVTTDTGMITSGIPFLDAKNPVVVKTSVTNAMLEAATVNGLELSFQAYALQAGGLTANTPEEMWKIFVADSGSAANE